MTFHHRAAREAFRVVLIGAVSLNVLACQRGDATPKAAMETAVPVFSHPTEITNPYLPLSSLDQDILIGKEGSDSTRVVRTRPGTTRAFDINGRSILTVVVIDSEFVNGALEEVTLDYFAQADDGGVYYFGEDVDTYEKGKITGHGGAWLYGVQTKTLGLLMPGHPQIGQKFRSEDVPGITVEDDEVMSLGESVTVPEGSYTNCLKIKESSGKEVEYKYYASNIGVVDEVPEGGRVSLIRHQ